MTETLTDKNIKIYDPVDYFSLNNDEKKEYRKETLASWQEDIDYNFLNYLKREKVTRLEPEKSTKTSYYQNAIHWNYETLEEIIKNSDNENIDIEVLKAYIDPKKNISYDDVVQLIIDKPQTLIAAMTLLSHNYNWETEEAEGTNPGPHNAQFVFSNREEKIFLTGRDLLIKLNETRRDPYLDELIEATDSVIYKFNKRLIWEEVKKYKIRLTWIDSFQNGTSGFCKGLSRFDIDEGTRFSTYVRWWIMQGIISAEQETSTTIRLPRHLNETLRLFDKRKKRLQQRLGREVTVDEVLKEYYRDILPMQLETLMRGISAMNLLSLDYPLDDDKDSTLLAYIEDKDSNPNETKKGVEIKEILIQLIDLAGLTPIEEDSLKLRFGIGSTPNDPGRTYFFYREIGEKCGIPKHKVRKIEAKAIDKLREAANNLGIILQSY